jgi:hypothetical protein
VDVRLRELERETAQGDKVARYALMVHRNRLGLCMDCGAPKRKRRWSDLADPTGCEDCDMWRLFCMHRDYYEKRGELLPAQLVENLERYRPGSRARRRKAWR